LERDKEEEPFPVPEELVPHVAVDVLAKFPKMMARMRPAMTRAHQRRDLYTSTWPVLGMG
jgi:hypothetical protein